MAIWINGLLEFRLRRRYSANSIIGRVWIVHSPVRSSRSQALVLRRRFFDESTIPRTLTLLSAVVTRLRKGTATIRRVLIPQRVTTGKSMNINPDNSGELSQLDLLFRNTTTFYKAKASESRRKNLGLPLLRWTAANREAVTSLSHHRRWDRSRPSL